MASARPDDDCHEEQRLTIDLPVSIWRFPCPGCAGPVDTAEWEPDDPCVVCCKPVPREPNASGIVKQGAQPLVLTRVKRMPDGYSRWQGRCPHCRGATVDWFFATDGEAFRCPSCGGFGYTVLFPAN